MRPSDAEQVAVTIGQFELKSVPHHLTVRLIDELQIQALTVAERAQRSAGTPRSR